MNSTFSQEMNFITWKSFVDILLYKQAQKRRERGNYISVYTVSFEKGKKTLRYLAVVCTCVMSTWIV